MGLRWAFQVWHPFRGLEGIFLELNALLGGKYKPPVSKESLAPSGEQAKTSLLTFLRGDTERIGKAHGEARKLLTTTALLTDVYFLYTPPQISFAAFLEADSALAEFYLDVKFPPTDSGNARVREKLLSVVSEIAKNHLSPTITKDSKNPYPKLLLQLPQNNVATSITDAVDPALLTEVTRIDKKLYRVTKRDQDNPPNSKKAKSDSSSNGTTTATKTLEKYDEDDERRIKKRKLEREKAERDGDVFGAPLPNNLRQLQL